jgi:hypothetical protein
MLVEAEQRRYPGFAAERPMTNQVASAPASSREVPDGLDWHTFSAASFPGRRRHDLQAVIAYGAYRRSYAVDEHTPETPSRIVAKRGAVASTALQEWEDEGGAAF